MHRSLNGIQRFVRRQVQRPEVDHREQALAAQCLQVDTQTGGPPQVFRWMFLEDRDHAWLALLHPRSDTLRRQHGLARAGRPTDEHRVTDGDTARHEGIESRHTGGSPAMRPGAVGLVRRDTHARVHLETRLADADGVQAGHGRQPTLFVHLQRPHDGVAVDAFGEREDPVSHREQRAGAQISVHKLPDQKGGGLPGRQMHRQALHETVQVELAGSSGGHPNDGLERVHDHDAGVGRLHLLDDGVEHRAQAIDEDQVAEINEANAGAEPCGIKEVKLLLVAQDLDRRLA